MSKNEKKFLISFSLFNLYHFFIHLLSFGETLILSNKCNENNKDNLFIKENEELRFKSFHFDGLLHNNRFTPKFSELTCDHLSSKNKTISNDGLHFLNNYDSLTQNDIVRNQYANLPYPAVKPEWLELEKYYYDNKEWPVKAYGEIRNKPFKDSMAITLEAINHFLYQGKNQFR